MPVVRPNRSTDHGLASGEIVHDSDKIARPDQAPFRMVAELLNRKAVLSFLFMLPAAGILLLFLTYPLSLGIWMGFTDARVGRPGVFIGLENFVSLFDDDVF